MFSSAFTPCPAQAFADRCAALLAKVFEPLRFKRRREAATFGALRDWRGVRAHRRSLAAASIVAVVASARRNRRLRMASVPQRVPGKYLHTLATARRLKTFSVAADSFRAKTLPGAFTRSAPGGCKLESL